MTKGVQIGYAGETPRYAYLSGDLTPAYRDAGTAERVVRSMLAVFDTGCADVPLCFFVCDDLTAKKETYQKTFLLHTECEPKIEGKTVTVVNGNGKLILQNLFGGDRIEGLGGDGRNYLIHGRQVDTVVPGLTDGYWGRVELSPAPGNKNDRMLNVLFVTDAEKSPALPARPITGEGVTGGAIGKIAALFAASDADSLSFTLPGKGDFDCYVAGVAPGEWTVDADGKTQTVSASEAGGLLVFPAPAGIVTLTR